MDTASPLLKRPPTAETGAFVPYRILPGDSACGYVIICDHAEPNLPEEYGDLGLEPSQFSRHIAYDPGAKAVSLRLAQRLNAPLVMSTFSRLLIDPNRGVDDPTLIMRLSDGAIVPGNRNVDAAERQKRIDLYYEPYHGAVSATLDAGMASGNVPALVSIHSFTPVWRGVARPWHAALLWDLDPRLPVPMLEGLRRDSDLIVGDNEPYTGQLAHDTISQHAEARGLAHALVEVRQDLIADQTGTDAWGDRLANVLLGLKDRAELHEVRHYPSRSTIDNGHMPVA